MSEWTEVRYGKRRGPPRGRPQHPRTENWHHPYDNDGYQPSLPRGRRPPIPPYNHPRFGARRADVPPRPWRPPPRADPPPRPRRPPTPPRYQVGGYRYPLREKPYHLLPRDRRLRRPDGGRRFPSPRRDDRPNVGSRGRYRRRPEDRMDRASSLPYRRDYHYNLTQPVPPPRVFQRYDPRSNTRSYADVTRAPVRDQDGHEIIRSPADPKTKELMTDLHAFIKAVHHLHNFSSTREGTTPRSISNMVTTLRTMIKPAAPTPTTHLLIEGAAREWGHTVCTILKQHYEDSIEMKLKNLSGRLTDDWKEAFQTATRWTRKHLTRLTGETIASAEAQLTALAEEELDPAPSLVTRPPPSLPRPQSGPPQTPAMSTVGLETQMAPPKEQRVPRAARNTSRDQPPEEAAGPSDRDDQQTEEIPGSPAPSTVPTARNKRVIPFPSAGSSDSEDLFDDEHTDEDLKGPRHTYRVTQHPHTSRKATEWELKVDKKWLIMGDSNLSVISNHNCPDLQIDSYPGATFRHAQTLIEKSIPIEGVTVEKIIMVFGINCRTYKVMETIFKQVQMAVRAANRIFPDAEIYVQQTNFNKLLPIEERDNLMTLNSLLEDNLHTISLLPSKLFSTGPDKIHWTQSTAKAFLDHWMALLNPTSP